jgi:hypothetical protein
MTTTPTFSQFRTGMVIPLPADKQMSYAELKQVGLQDYYIRIIHELASQGKLARPQVDHWLRQLSARDRFAEQAVRAELEGHRSASVGLTRSAPQQSPKRTRTEPVHLLMSRGNHKQAVKTAQSYGLHPLPVPPNSLLPGQSPDAHTVRAAESVASKLITSGHWKTAD